MEIVRKLLAVALSVAMVLMGCPVASASGTGAGTGYFQDAPPLTSQELDNIASPIALYPDQLIAQILGAATYPDQIEDANNFVKSNPSLQGDNLSQAVDQQDWDPSVKALTQFPTVLDQMAQNQAWTATLGDASFNQQAQLMASIQRLRAQAQAAGNLKSSPQLQVVQQAPQTIVIQPANPDVVYVPQYNPAVVYGVPYDPPGYSTAALVTTGILAFGLGIAIGASIHNSCCGWGWGRGGWGMGWGAGHAMYGGNVYVSRSMYFSGANRYNYRRAYFGGARPTPYRPGFRPPPFHGSSRPPGYRPPPNNGRPGGGNIGRPNPGGNNGGRPNPGGNIGRPNPGGNNGGRPPGGGERPGGNNGGRPPGGGERPGGSRPNPGGGQPGGSRPRPSTPVARPAPAPRPSPAARPAPGPSGGGGGRPAGGGGRPSGGGRQR